MYHMKRVILASLVLLICLPLQADIREAFVCNYRDGKGLEDVLAARDYYVEQFGKADLETPQAFVWTPWKSYGDIDLLWFNVHEDFATFARRSDAGAGTDAVAAIMARFNKVADCQSGLLSREVVFDGGKFDIPNTGSDFIQCLQPQEG